MTEKELAAALNEHLRRYIDNPEGYAREFEVIREFQRQDGSEISQPSYGKELARYLFSL